MGNAYQKIIDGILNKIIHPPQLLLEKIIA